ncbi:acyl-CoA dehydrogenase, partial [Streptomyces sp. NPDC052020]|uniref:acyl-CoA dehydrogenase family protein n=1 Tax=Streptomyces sp. NPDC052020 TaxID=3155677 RepID=UPI00342F4828
TPARPPTDDPAEEAPMTLLTIHHHPTHNTTPTPDTPGTGTPGTGTPHPETGSPRPDAGLPHPETGSPRAEELSHLLFDKDGPDHSHDTWRELVSRDEFRYTPHLSHTERVAQSYRRLRLVNDTIDDAEELAGNPGRLAALHEWIGFTDGGLCTVASIHYNLFLGSLLDHADPARPRDLTPYTTLKNTGTFLCTELDHGNDAAALQTTAHYNPHTNDFTLHTPTPGARKFMPNTSLTGGPKTALVAARLISHGQDHGVYLFLTPLHHHDRPHPGITIQPLPPTNGPTVDHCLTSFRHVRLPRHALLESDHGRLNPDGNLSSHLGNHRKRFLRSINRVTTGKLCMSAGCLGMARAALAIAVRHAHIRHTSGPKRNQRIPLAHHRTHHAPLLNHIATTYAMTFLHRMATNQWTHHTPDNKTETERLVALTKAFITWQARDIATQARERCGAHGLFPHNGIADLPRSIEGGITAEGDNLVILTKAAAEMLLTQPPTPSHSPTSTPIPHTPLTDLTFLRNLLAHTQTIWHTRAHTALRQGPTRNPTQRWNQAAPAALTMTTTHTQLRATDAFLDTIDHTSHPPTKALLQHLARLYLLNTLAPHTGDLLAHNHLHPHHIHTLHTTTNQTHATLTPHMSTLTQAFQHPTHTPTTDYEIGAW